MLREKSPNNKYEIEFDGKYEVGMGGPEIGDVYINGKKLEFNFMNSWVWSLDSEKLLLLEFIGRAPDKTRICVYDFSKNELQRYKLECGYTIYDVTFDGCEIKHHNHQWGSIFLRSEDIF